MDVLPWIELYTEEWDAYLLKHCRLYHLKNKIYPAFNTKPLSRRKYTQNDSLINKLYPLQTIHFIKKVSNIKGEICVVCGALHFNKDPFCSGECSIPYCEENGIWYQRVKLKVSKKYCKKFNSEFRTRVRMFFGNICFLCGKTENENGKKLSIHHVTYDKQTLCNNKKAPFVPLCSSCHSKTNGNRKRWEKILTDKLNEEYNLKCYFTADEFYNIAKVTSKNPDILSELEAKNRELELLREEIEILKLHKTKLLNGFYPLL